jgi:hypothetical protein
MDIMLECPHCNIPFIVNINEINCAIFRHAVFKTNMKPINPHESESKCNELIEKNLIYGCTKPFKIIIIDNKYITQICDYI